MEYKKILNCKDCYFFFNVNIGGKMYPWCFHTSNNGLIRNARIANHCSGYDDFKDNVDLKPDSMSKNQKDQRNNKIKRKSQIFRFHYKINNKIAYIISRFSHWIIVLSDDKEHLYHQNITKPYEYEHMLLFNKPEFHLHKVLDNSPMAIQELFEEIENHDIYVLKHRYQASIRSEKFNPDSFVGNQR